MFAGNSKQGKMMKPANYRTYCNNRFFVWSPGDYWTFGLIYKGSHITLISIKNAMYFSNYRYVGNKRCRYLNCDVESFSDQLTSID